MPPVKRSPTRNLNKSTDNQMSGNEKVTQSSSRTVNSRCNKADKNGSSPSVRDYFSRLNANDSTNASPGVSEMSKVISNSASRKASVKENIEKINLIPDELVRNALLGLADSLLNIVGDDMMTTFHINKLIEAQNGTARATTEIAHSVDNIAEAVDKIGNGYASMEGRVESLETKDSCTFDNQFLRVFLRDEKESEELEKGRIFSMPKFFRIIGAIDPKFEKSNVVNVSLLSATRRIDGQMRKLKYLNVRFNNTLSAGQTFGKFVRWNNEKKKAGDPRALKYYVELPASKNVYKLKRICLDMKAKGYIKSVISTDRGLVAYYKENNESPSADSPSNNSTPVTKDQRHVITTMDDIDSLRQIIGVENCDVPAEEIYNDDYWSAKAERNKRRRSSSEEQISPTSKTARVGSA
jgi:hypothetical protein